MDPALERLVRDPSCRDSQGRWLEAAGPCAPDNAAFKRLVSQYGFAFAPSAMHSARTTGVGGFHIGIEAQFTDIEQGASYWERGTQGDVSDTTGEPSATNDDPSSLLQLYSVKVRKGFGFGLEVTGIVGFMPQTSILSGGADVRMALLEGFREGVAGYLPDVAVGAGARTITGTPGLQLTVLGLDAQISKPIPIADAAVITPWVGYQYVWMFANSGVTDLTPGTDAVGDCRYTGPNVPGNGDPDKPGVFDGQPVCAGGSERDFNNNAVFDAARLERQRILLGLSYRYEMLMVGGQFSTDLIAPADAQSNAADERALAGQDRQFSIALEAGVMF